MALRFCDSADHYVTANIGTKWSGYGATTIVSGGRSGTCLQTGDDSHYFNKILTSQTTWFVGFAFKFSESAPTTNSILTFYDGATVHTQLHIDSTQHMYFSRNGTAIGSTGTSVLSINTWYYLEAKVKIGDASGDGNAGEISLRINGIENINNTNVDTRNGGNASADKIQFNGINGQTCNFDDIYVCDSTGSSPNNTFLGDVRIEVIYPTAAGDTTSWTPSAGSNYDCVNDATPNSDTDYVSSSTADQIDTYTMGDMVTGTGVIYGVQCLLFARKDDAGSRSIAPVLRPASTDYVGTTVSIADTYTYVMQINELNPEDSAAWEIADINGLKYGVKLVA
jgi:hypothetical protein